MIQWQDALNTGIEEIDEQHRNLIAINNKAYGLTQLDDGIDHYDEIVKIIKELTDYTEYHFGFEEKLLTKCKYAELEEQKMEHFFFMKKLSKMDLTKIDQDQEKAVQNILEMLVDWISSHIMTNDMKYVSCLRSNGM